MSPTFSLIIFVESNKESSSSLYFLVLSPQSFFLRCRIFFPFSFPRPYFFLNFPFPSFFGHIRHSGMAFCAPPEIREKRVASRSGITPNFPQNPPSKKKVFPRWTKGLSTSRKRDLTAVEGGDLSLPSQMNFFSLLEENGLLGTKKQRRE